MDDEKENYPDLEKPLTAAIYYLPMMRKILTALVKEEI